MSNCSNLISSYLQPKSVAFLDPEANSNDHYALPDELYLKIFSYLSPVDLLKVTHTTSEGRRLGYDSQVWKETAEKVSLFIEDGMKTQLAQELDSSEEGFSCYRFTKQALHQIFPPVFRNTSSQELHNYVDPLEKIAQKARNLLIILTASEIADDVSDFPESLRNINAESLSYVDLAQKEMVARTWMLANKAVLSQIRTLFMRNKGLKGYLPDELGLFIKLRSLSLWDNEISHIPDSIGKLTKLQELDLNNNPIAQIPETMEQNENLRRLYLSRNRLDHMPSLIGRLRKLEMVGTGYNQINSISKDLFRQTMLTTIFIAHCNITTFPKELCNQKSLTSLDLSSNQILTIPNEIMNLENLSCLNLSNNQIDRIPSELWSLPKLENFNLSSNKIDKTSKKISKLTNLNVFDLSLNLISEIPNAIGDVKTLSVLRLSNNRITIIPDTLKKLCNLVFLNLSGNLIVPMPNEIGRLKQKDATVGEFTILPNG